MEGELEGREWAQRDSKIERFGVLNEDDRSIEACDDFALWKECKSLSCHGGVLL